MLSVFTKIKSGLKKTKDAMVGKIDSILKKFSKINSDFFYELEETLILADVGAVTSEKICDQLKENVKKNGISEPYEIRENLKHILTEMLGHDSNVCENEDLEGTKPILVVGVNGVGKTTTIGKLANNYIKKGKSVLLSAADTFRAAAIDQLEVWGAKAGALVIKQKEGSDPAAVVYDSINAAKARNINVVICDTAGRLHNKKNLMDELSKINRVILRELPNSKLETLLVVDATTGQNAINQVKEFKKITNVTGIVLTKLDGTAKGGIAFAIKNELNVPIKYIGVGEKIDDLQKFNPKQFVDALFEN